MTLKIAGEIMPNDTSASDATVDGQEMFRFYPMPGVPKRLMPRRAHVGDASYDLYNAGDEVVVRPGQVVRIRCGYGVRLKPNEVALVCPRFHLAELGLTVVNAPGIIDTGNVMDIAVILTSVTKPILIKHGEAMAQLLIVNHSDEIQ